MSQEKKFSLPPFFKKFFQGLPSWYPASHDSLPFLHQGHLCTFTPDCSYQGGISLLLLVDGKRSESSGYSEFYLCCVSTHGLWLLPKEGRASDLSCLSLYFSGFSGPLPLYCGLLWLSFTKSLWEDNIGVTEIACQVHIFSMGQLAFQFTFSPMIKFEK